MLTCPSPPLVYMHNNAVGVVVPLSLFNLPILAFQYIVLGMIVSRTIIPPAHSPVRNVEEWNDVTLSQIIK